MCRVLRRGTPQSLIGTDETAFSASYSNGVDFGRYKPLASWHDPRHYSHADGWPRLQALHEERENIEIQKRKNESSCQHVIEHLIP